MTTAMGRSSSSTARYSCGLWVYSMTLILDHFCWYPSVVLNIDLVYQYRITSVLFDPFLWKAKYRADKGGLSSRWMSLRSSCVTLGSYPWVWAHVMRQTS